MHCQGKNVPLRTIMSDIASELAKLQTLTGSEFVMQLKCIVSRKEFHPFEGDKNIYVAGGRQKNDFDNLLSAARKVVEHGYRVFILPNPKDVRTADFIFVQKGIYKMYDLKTIYGKMSVMNRLKESIGQTNHVLLNMATDYHGMALARSIKKYFELNPMAMEVMIFKGNKVIVVTPKSLEDKNFLYTFHKRYNK